MKTILFVLMTVACTAQTADRVFYFAHADTVQSQQEIATVIRTMADIKAVSNDKPAVRTDATQSSLTVTGTPEQLALADWIFKTLDQAGPVQPGQEVRSYTYSGGGDNAVRAFFLTHGQTVQQFQEIATAIRTVSEIRRVFTYNAQRAMVIRGTLDQAKMAEWLVSKLDRPIPPTKQHLVSEQFETPVNGHDGDTLLRVFYAASPTNISEFQTLATFLRSMSQIRREFTYDEMNAIVIRTDATGMAIGQWVFDDVDQPSNRTQPVHEFRPPTAADDVVRVFYPNQDAITVAKQIQTGTSLKIIVPDPPLKEIGVRGPAAEIARASQIVTALQ